MPSYAGSAREEIGAPVAEVWEAMLDYDRLPEWQRAVRLAEVVERDKQGRGVEVAYEIDVKVGVVHYTLRHAYEEPRRISSSYVEGDFRDCRGQWTFEDLGGVRTRACFELEIDPGRIMPRPVVKMLNSRVMKGSVEDLRRRFGG